MPPGLLMWTITALAFELASRSSASVRCRLPRISPSMVTRAIEPPGPPVMAPRWPVNTTPAPTTATMATSTVTTRQNVSLRRMRRRSTIRSASSDMVFSSNLIRNAL